MPYALELKTEVTSKETDKLEILFKDALTGLNTNYVVATTVAVPSNSNIEVPLLGIEKLVVIAVVSSVPIDISLQDDVGSNPIYSQVSSKLYLRTFANPGIQYGRVMLKGGATGTTARVFAAGNSV